MNKTNTEWFKSILLKITALFKTINELNDADYFKPLHETKRMILGHVYEEVSLIEKHRNEVMFCTDVYGNPTCGIISQKNDWCIICGSHSFILWTPKGTVRFEDENFLGAHDLRQIDDNTVEILIDPWSDKAAIWRFNIATEHAVKIRDFDDYKGKEYTNDVDW